jgi:methylthioribulose-1-phosphate dehydratase
VDALIRAGQLFHQRGWVPGTAGNLSFRQPGEDSIRITRSGCHKGELREKDVVAVDLDGNVVDSSTKCSAETLLHCQLYRRFPAVGSVLHTHSVWSTLISGTRDVVVLQGYELQKALAGIETHEARIEIPVFENDQDIRRLSGVVGRWLDATSSPHAYLIKAHGLYTWGETVESARYRIEALEFLFECEQRRSQSG